MAIRYFKQAVNQLEDWNCDHIANQLRKYLASKHIDDNTKVAILKQFTESQSGKNKIIAERISNPVVKVTKRISHYLPPHAKPVYCKTIVIDTDRLKITKLTVRG